jgi:phosphatidylserine/phosphatidylglycerophosphate/cardiolipin synthase-like enzyme
MPSPLEQQKRLRAQIWRKSFMVVAVFLVAGIAFSIIGVKSISSSGSRIILDGKTEIHYAPEESLEPLDVSLIDEAITEIDFAAYVLTDVPVIQALTRAADRGVRIRLYLYEEQLPTHGYPHMSLQELIETPTLETRIKPATRPLMHIKAYQIDKALLRTGSANFSASVEKQQDNDIIVIHDPKAAEGFKHKFEAMWGSAWAKSSQ